MQKLFILGLILPFYSISIFGQAVAINQDGSLPNAKSILDVKSTTKGLLAPRMTSAQRIAIAPAAAEEGMIVYDTDLNKYMLWTGTIWETVGDGLWTSHTLGAYRLSHVSVNAVPFNKANFYVFGDLNEIGPDTSTVYIHRSGSNISTEGGSNWTINGVDAALKAYAFWGNSYSSAVSAYSFLDFNNSAALIAANNNASTISYLAYKDNSGRIWAGYLTGDMRISGQLGVGVTPGIFTNFHSETSSYDRSGYFYNTRNTINTTYGIYAGAYGAGSGPKRGGAFEAVGGTGTNIAIRALAQGGSVNWAGYFVDGNVYVADNVTIGTEDFATGYILSVNGKIISEELRIQDMVDWPDYVFVEDYPLMSLYDLEKSIHLHHKLPGIPSASEIEKDGILVGDMQRMMMQKIEELTLYTIAQQKQIDKQQTEIEELKSLILEQRSSGKRQ